MSPTYTGDKVEGEETDEIHARKMYDGCSTTICITKHKK